MRQIPNRESPPERIWRMQGPGKGRRRAVAGAVVALAPKIQPIGAAAGAP
jgi:hypothetical protein